MAKIRVVGGNQLNGEIPISGAKNAALPLMIASLLTNEKLVLRNVPDLADVRQLKKILSNHGTKITSPTEDKSFQSAALSFETPTITDTCAPYDLVAAMRASFWVIGPLLAREHKARVSLPGGCAIGSRPVDYFINGLKALGAHIEIDEGYVVATAPGGLVGTMLRLPTPSVGATHTILMAATLARGTTTILNAAMEPEITNVADCLVAMGAKIKGIGTRKLVIEGVKKLHGATIDVVPDRIEAGTFAMAVAMTGGDVLLRNAKSQHLQAALDVLQASGVDIVEESGGIRVRATGERLKAVDVEIDTFPGFPTDLQAQYMTLMTRANGTTKIKETIFENRFMHVAELTRFGAKIEIEGQVATVSGVKTLKGAQVMATDLRASVSLIIAGLVASGETIVSRVYHLDRGFERLEEKLSACGAKVERIND
ncbi:MAG: UDP-N-acetylglucosamine 1-carboxyvinyltransferase [Devosiaceae bacterium]|nr:UDP-N-acetylglucosamine 1-carboxyvinyltransferase [Devosiaceae bacterium]